MSTIRLPYRSKPLVMALSGLFFAGCGVVLFKTAQDNDRGLTLNGIIHLATGGATTFYWVLTALCVGFVLFAVLGTIRAFGSTHEVMIDDRMLSAPRSGLSGTIVTVPLATITGLQIRGISRQRFLNVLHAGGKLTIQASMLPASGDLDMLAEEIDRRRSAQSAGAMPSTPSVDPMAPSRGQFGRRSQ